MPDFSLCLNKECPLKDNCKRYISKPDEMQYYSEFTYDKEKKQCDYFMPTVIPTYTQNQL